LIDPKICPFCHKENLCEIGIPNRTCWCDSIKVPPILREYIPSEKRMKTCICKNCIDEFNENSKSFIQKYDLTK
jgi:hypothetical protein